MTGEKILCDGIAEGHVGKGLSKFNFRLCCDDITTDCPPLSSKHSVKSVAPKNAMYEESRKSRGEKPGIG